MSIRLQPNDTKTNYFFPWQLPCLFTCMFFYSNRKTPDSPLFGGSHVSESQKDLFSTPAKIDHT